MIKEIIDIAEYSAANKEVPKGCKYRIKIDKTQYVVEQSTITGREILDLAEKTNHEKWLVNQRLKGGNVKRIELDDVVDLTTKGIEKFMTLPTDQTDGELRKQFSLPSEDEEYLDFMDFQYELIIEKNVKWVLIENLNIPAGYNVSKAKIALRIDNGYPISQIDMVYFYPALVRLDNKPIHAITNQVIDNLSFQRWSRHRTANNPWRHGVDDLSTHITLVQNWLVDELKRNV